MTISTLPSTAVPFEGQNDQGKRVIIKTPSGAFENVAGTVISGPYTFTYKRNREEKGVRRKGPIITSSPYWQVLVDGYDLYLSFVREEFVFSQGSCPKK